MSTLPHAVPFALLLCAALAGCSSSPAPQTAGSPPVSAPLPVATGQTGDGGPDVAVGFGDSVSAIPGSPDALYRYRFKQIDPPSDRFTFQDRDLSFYFKPAPGALTFQVENRQNRPFWIEWERSTFYPPRGSSGKVAHASTTWPDRFRIQPATQISGLQRYGDYLFPLDYLLDPSGASQQLHRPLFPEDGSAPQYVGSEFGVDLVFRIEDRFRTYSFRFRADSILPR